MLLSLRPDMKSLLMLQRTGCVPPPPGIPGAMPPAPSDLSGFKRIPNEQRMVSRPDRSTFRNGPLWCVNKEPTLSRTFSFLSSLSLPTKYTSGGSCNKFTSRESLLEGLYLSRCSSNHSPFVQKTPPPEEKTAPLIGRREKPSTNRFSPTQFFWQAPAW